jgi:hypothetical protein
MIYLLRDFTGCKELYGNYRGSDKKFKAEIDGKAYMLKFPDPSRGKTGKEMSYIGNVYSEYIGCKVFKSIGISVQEVVLGTYTTKNLKNKVVCACKDFTTSEIHLSEFENFVIGDVESKENNKMELSNIEGILSEKFSEERAVEIIEQFWDMFVVDALIGNTDRHNGNWGVLYNNENQLLGFSPIYDCGSSLNPTLSDEKITLASSTDIHNFALNTYSALTIEGKRINYAEYILSGNNKQLDLAIKRTYPNIHMREIINIINGIESMSNIRKKFLIEIVRERYNNVLSIRFEKVNGLEK